MPTDWCRNRQLQLKKEALKHSLKGGQAMARLAISLEKK